MLGMIKDSSIVLLASLAIVRGQWPADSSAATVREIEHLYLDAASHNLQSFVTPCNQYIDSSTGSANSKLGRQTAAEWIRTAFHDFVTADIYTQSGGLDASIGFETTRGENVGTAFNDALINFSYYFSKAVSMADLIAIGTAIAAGHCGSTPVPVQVGRIDATAAGPSGVPQPQQNLQTQLNQFGNAGFNRDDTIALTACGHSMGGVHKKSFPDVISPGTPGTCDGSDCRIAFDETVDALDVKVVTDYLDGTGARGGPLVTTTNYTDQSDLRLYDSDQNATMKQLAKGGNSYYKSQCAELFGRMIGTVPSSVHLTRDITPTSSSNNLKPANLNLNVDWKGNMQLSGFLRFVQVSGTTAPASIVVTLVGRNGKTTKTTATATKSTSNLGTGIVGPTYQYPFTLKFSANTGVAGIQASGQTFALQDTMFVMPGSSGIKPSVPAFVPTPAMATVQPYSVNVTVAYLTKAAPTSLKATLSYPTSQNGSIAPKIDSSTTATMKKIGVSGPFTIYSTIVKKSLSTKQAYGSSFDIADGTKAPGVVFYKLWNPLA